MWRRATSMRTVMVLSALSEVTTPWRTLGRPSPCSARGVPSPGPARRALAPARSRGRRRRRASSLTFRARSRAAWRSSGVFGVAAPPDPRLRLRRAPRRSLGSWGGASATGGVSSLGGTSSGEAGEPGTAPSSVPPASPPSGVTGASGSASGVVSSGVSGVSAIVGLVRVQAALARERQGAGHVTLGVTQRRGVLQLAGGVLEAKAEQLAPSVGQVVEEPAVVEVPELRGVGSHGTQPSSRSTNLVFTGSLWPARRMASRARGSGTPASLHITRAVLTTAPQPSSLPLPEPMRVSAAFFVYGLSGNTLIQTLPPRLILRVMAIRAASIWRLVSHPASSDLSPYSPNSTRC